MLQPSTAILYSIQWFYENNIQKSPWDENPIGMARTREPGTDSYETGGLIHKQPVKHGGQYMGTRVPNITKNLAFSFPALKINTPEKKSFRKGV
jgi:hypothetical protein